MIDAQRLKGAAMASLADGDPLTPEAVSKAPERAGTAKPVPSIAELAREFQSLADDRYRLMVPQLGIVVEVDRLRREHSELNGELSVSCKLPGARTIEDGSLSIADFNLSSARARQERAKLLALRSNAAELDWTGLLEEFCQRVLRAERTGQPAVDLRTVPRPNAADDVLEIDGFALPRRHPSILFGDGGTAKSYTGLHVAGRMAQEGIRVAYFDWELAAEEHRDRLQRLFPDHMPRILYARCERALVHEVDRLRRIVSEAGVEFIVYDSVAFACDGPPESAETAGRYYRAVRQIGGGSLHIAHITKGEGADKKPFGSAFWHNGARSTWYAQVSGESREDDALRIGLFNRKSNLGRLRPPLGYTISFGDDRTTFQRNDVADSPDLAGQLSVRQRMASLLRRGSMSWAEVAEEIDADVETVRRTARRYKDRFTVIDGKRVGLTDKRTA
jgi:AAA domain